MLFPLLQHALMSAHRQWTMYVQSASLCTGVARSFLQESFAEHAADELKHIEVLQHLLLSLGAEPTLERLEVPALQKGSSNKQIVGLHLAFEQEAVQMYSKILEFASDSVEWTTELRKQIENILSCEQEHVYDFKNMRM